MKPSPAAVQPDASLADAARLLAATDATDLYLVDDDGLLVGVLTEGDLIRAVLPDLDEIIAAGGSTQDAMDAFVAKGRRLANQTIRPYVIPQPLSVAPTDHAAVAATLLTERQIRRLPVVEDGRLVGTVSRGDVVRGVIDGATP
jgi:CBS domain-containing protein